MTTYAKLFICLDTLLLTPSFTVCNFCQSLCLTSLRSLHFVARFVSIDPNYSWYFCWASALPSVYSALLTSNCLASLIMTYAASSGDLSSFTYIYFLYLYAIISEIDILSITFDDSYRDSFYILWASLFEPLRCFYVSPFLCSLI